MLQGWPCSGRSHLRPCCTLHQPLAGSVTATGTLVWECDMPIAVAKCSLGIIFPNIRLLSSNTAPRYSTAEEGESISRYTRCSHTLCSAKAARVLIRSFSFSFIPACHRRLRCLSGRFCPILIWTGFQVRVQSCQAWVLCRPRELALRGPVIPQRVVASRHCSDLKHKFQFPEWVGVECGVVWGRRLETHQHWFPVVHCARSKRGFPSL